MGNKQNKADIKLNTKNLEKKLPSSWTIVQEIGRGNHSMVMIV